MKTAATVLMMLVLAVCHVAADEASPAPINTKSLISSIPTRFERERWEAESMEQRSSPEEAKLAQKMKDAPANCKKLLSLLVRGKPLSDFPGLLDLGEFLWNAEREAYELSVGLPMGRIGSGACAGFVCRFDKSYTIIRAHGLWTPGY